MLKSDRMGRPPSVAAFRTEAVAWKRLPGAVLFALLGAVLSSTFIYLVAWGLGFIPQDVVVMTPYGPGSMTLGAVATGSAVGALGGSGVFALVGKVARRPLRLFRIVATLALLPTLRTPFTIPEAPMSMILSLAAMHVATYAVTVVTLTTLARREKDLER